MIGFTLEKDEFEYDARGLLMSFFPGEELIRDPDGETSVSLTVAIPAPPAEEDRNRRKNLFKRDLYRRLSAMTGRTLPWGTLTGIRPVRIVSDMLEEGRLPEEAAALFRDRYLVSREKAELALAIALEERAVLAGKKTGSGWSLYIGIPFCPTRCLYCSFTSVPARDEEQMASYLDTLVREIRWAAEFHREGPDSIYIGGGTPTALPAGLLDRLLAVVCLAFRPEGREFTVEAGRPDSLDREKLRIMRRYPVTRICVNPQTMKQETLDRIGRRHTAEDTLRAYAMAREEGFDDINMDIILGLPGEKPADVADTLGKIEELSPDSLTVHALAVKRASRMKMEAEGPLPPEHTQEEAEQMAALAAASAGKMGMRPYYLYRQKNMTGNLENTGYARPGKACWYNIVNMEEIQSVTALGAGTVSKLVCPDGRIERCDNVRDIALYQQQIGEMIRRKELLFGDAEEAGGNGSGGRQEDRSCVLP